MRIAMGSDHAGFEPRATSPRLRAAGHEVVDLGTDSEESTDYPLFAEPAARMVADGEAERGVLVCGSGVGVNDRPANKVDGVRAVNAHDVGEASLARRHNDVNVLMIPLRPAGAPSPQNCDRYRETFLDTAFEGGREQRVELISEVERRGALALVQVPSRRDWRLGEEQTSGKRRLQTRRAPGHPMQ